MRNKRVIIPTCLLFGAFLSAVHSHRSAVQAFEDQEAVRGRRMNAMIVQVRADTLFEAIDQISRQSGCPIRIDRKSLEAASTDDQTPCRVRLFDVTLAESLKVIGQTYYLRTHLGWWWEGETLALSTAEEMSKHTTTLRAYDVRDLTWVEDAIYDFKDAPNTCFGGKGTNCGRTDHAIKSAIYPKPRDLDAAPASAGVVRAELLPRRSHRMARWRQALSGAIQLPGQSVPEHGSRRRNGKFAAVLQPAVRSAGR